MSEPQHKSIVTAPHVEVQQRMHPLVERALALNPDPATLEKFLALQERWEAGEAKKAYTRALTAVKRDLPTVLHRDKLVDYPAAKGRVTYRHTSLAAVVDRVTPALTQHGFSLGYKVATTVQGSTVSMVTVTCILTHTDGHQDEMSLSAPPDNTGGKSPPQQVASTITLLERYSALALLGIATEDMPEPTGEGRDENRGNSNAVDANRNLRVVGQLAKYGKTKQDAEEFLGRTVDQWTDADIKNLEAWVKQPKRDAEE